MEQYHHKLLNMIETHFGMTEDSPEGLRKIEAFLRDVFNSFGACELCWGRGYNAILDGNDNQINHPADPQIKMDYCTCRRGKDLKFLVGE